MAVGTIRLFMDNALFFSFNSLENQKDYSLLSMKLKEEVNTLSHLSITTLFNHPRIRQIVVRKSTFVLTDDDECLFIGKVLSMSRNMANEVTIEIEDLLGCLRDIVRPGYEYEMRAQNQIDYIPTEIGGLSPYRRFDTYSTLFYIDIAGKLTPSVYNSLYTIPSGIVTLDEAISSASTGGSDSDDVIYADPVDTTVGVIGEVTTYGDDEISKKDATNISAFKNYLSILYDDINAEAGGIAYPKVLGSIENNNTISVNYIINSYTLHYTRAPLYKNIERNDNGEIIKSSYSNVPDFQFGVNILDFEIEPAVNDPITEIAPTGTYKIPNTNEQRLVMRDTGTRNYTVANIKALQKYGPIQRNIDFGYIGEFDYYDDAKQCLTDVCEKFVNERLGPFGDRITITGIDPYYMKKSDDQIRLRRLVHVVSSSHDIDIYDYCLSCEIDFFNHEHDRYIIGPFIPSNYFDFKETNVKRKSVEEIIANGVKYKKETGGLYVNDSYVQDALSI